mgnify:FL=1
MRVHQLHSWSVTPDEAISIQQELKGWVIPQDQFIDIRTVAYVEACIEANTICCATVHLYRLPTLTTLEQYSARERFRFPAIDGLSAFQRAPAVLAALGKLRVDPDLIICDGPGLTHPRRFGLACHVGVLTNIPTIGLEEFDNSSNRLPLLKRRGAWVPGSRERDMTSGILCLRPDLNPVVISPGHKISLHSAMKHLLRCVPRNPQHNSLEAVIYPTTGNSHSIIPSISKQKSA